MSHYLHDKTNFPWNVVILNLIDYVYRKINHSRVSQLMDYTLCNYDSLSLFPCLIMYFLSLALNMHT